MQLGWGVTVTMTRKWLVPLGTSGHQHRTCRLRMTQCKTDIGGHGRAVVEVRYQE